MANAIVDALKSHGHILIVKGGSTSLAREIEEQIAEPLVSIVPRIVPRVEVEGEVTSTFGHEDVDDEVEDLVDEITETLMDSDHVEDVFAEDNVIARDIFRVARDILLSREALERIADEVAVRVELDQLGYVAREVAKTVSPALLREAMTRAAADVEAEMISFEYETREAAFDLRGGGAERRQALLEKVVDRLTDLVKAGIAKLPTIERVLKLAHETTARDRASLKPEIDAVAKASLLPLGCAATWGFADPQTIKVIFTPLSENDASAIDKGMAVFEKDVKALMKKAHLEGASVPKEAKGEAPVSKKAAVKDAGTARLLEALAAMPALKKKKKAEAEPEPEPVKSVKVKKSAEKKASSRKSTAAGSKSVKKKSVAVKSTAAPAKAKKTVKTGAKKRG